MLLNIILIVDLVLLAVVIAVYFKYSIKERKLLHGQVGQAEELRQSVYQTWVLKEIGERIGYSFDIAKLVEVITSSLQSLLDYDVLTFLVLSEKDGKYQYKSSINNSVSHLHLDSVRAKLLASLNLLTGQEYRAKDLDESITGNILDDNIKAGVGSYFCVPIFLSAKLVGLVLISSTHPGQYLGSKARVLYSIVSQASTTVTKLQEVLANEKEKLIAIINSMTDGVVMVDMRNEVLVSNPAIKQLLEITSSSDLTIYDLVDALAGKVDMRTKIEQAINSHAPVQVRSLKLPNHILELTITPVRTKDGEFLGAAAVFHDITTEKDLEKLRQDFTAMMVHELRAPLTAVRWAGESLAKQALKPVEPDKLHETAMNITAASKNMLALVNDLLDMAKIEAGKFDLNIQEYDLVGVIQEQVQIFNPVAIEKHLQLSATVPEKLVISCDRVRITQILENLISNAIKYSESGEIMVTLNLDLVKNMAVVAVKDSGLGISRDELPQLFSKFRQLKTTDNSRKGTGLGLAVAKGIVEAHGGQIWAESPGENLGATFYFSIPLSRKPGTT